MNNRLCQLEEYFKEEVSANRKSLFRLSFELTQEDKDVLKDVRDVVMPYVRMACWMSDFYTFGTGWNYRQCWSELGSNARAWVDEIGIWKSVFGAEHLDGHAFKSKVWMLLGELAGGASDVWDVLRLIQSKQESQDGDLFQFATYLNDEPPAQLRLILSDDKQHSIEKEEFVDFILSLRKRDPAVDKWYRPLLEMVQNKFEKLVGATSGFYLRWVGVESADVNIIVGFDHVQQHGKLKAVLDEDDELFFAPPYRSFVVDARAKHVLKYCKRLQEYDGCPYGAYQRYVLSTKDSRNTWWKKIGTGGAVRFETDEVLLCLPEVCDVQAQFAKVGIRVEVETLPLRFDGEKAPTPFVLVKVFSRPLQECIVDLGKMSVTFAGMRPILAVEGVESDSISLEDGQLFKGSVLLTVENVPELRECRWDYGGEKVITPDAVLNITPDDNRILDLWIKCTPVALDGKPLPALHRHLVVLPRVVADVVEGHTGTALPKGWELNPVGVSERYVVYRAQNLKEWDLVSAVGDKQRVLLETRDLDWWFEAAAWITNTRYVPSVCAEFDRLSELDGYTLCLPENIGQIQLKVQIAGRTKGVDLAPYPVVDSLRRLPLSDIFGGGLSFIHGAECEARSLFVNGVKVCSVTPIPRLPVVWERQGQYEVFLPSRSRKREDVYRVFIYNDELPVSDLIKPPHELIDGGVKWQASEDHVHISLEAPINAYSQQHPSGELHVVLVPDRLFRRSPSMVCMPFFLEPAEECGGEFCSVVRVREGRSPLTVEGEAGFKAIKLQWDKVLRCLPKGHPYRTSRLRTMHACLRYDECFKYWQEFVGCPSSWKMVLWSMLMSGYNFLMEDSWCGQNIENLVLESAKILDPDSKRGRPKPLVYQNVCEQLVDNGDAKVGRNILIGKGLCPLLIAFDRIEKNLPFVYEERTLRSTDWKRIRPQQILELTALTRFEQEVKKTEFNSFGVYAVISYGDEEQHYPVTRVRQGEVSTSPGTIKTDNSGKWRFGYNPDVVLKGYRVEHTPAGRLALFSRFKQYVPDDVISLVKSLAHLSRGLDVLMSRLTQLFPESSQQRIVSSFYEHYKSYGFTDLSLVGRCGVIISTVHSLSRIKVPAGDLLAPDSEGYAHVLNLVRELYRNRFINDDADSDKLAEVEWRELMRIVTFTYSQYHYLLKLP